MFAMARYNENGQLDSKFDGDGKVLTFFDNEDEHSFIQSVVVDRHNRIIAVGGFEGKWAIARYLENGKLDEGFGLSGKLTLQITGNNPYGESADCVSIDNNDRIVVGGNANKRSPNNDNLHHFGLIRLTDSGELDGTFGNNGKVITDFHSGESESASDLIIDSNGRITVSGSILISESYQFALARYTENGELDSTFDGDGKVITNINTTNSEHAGSIGQDSEGKTVVAGTGYTSTSGKTYLALARYTENGELDSTFDADGKVLLEYFSLDSEGASALIINSDDHIFVAGYGVKTLPNSSSRKSVSTLTKFLSNGKPDQTFDGDGKVITEFQGSSRASSIVIDNHQNIVTGGTVDNKFSLARYLENGQLDPTFDGDGKVITDFFSTDLEYSTSLAIDNQDRIVLAGRAVRNVEPLL